jgi:hypothetical protein
MTRRVLAAAGAFVFVSALAASDANPTGEFTATAKVETPSGTRSMGLTVVVLRPMTLEEAQPLKKTLAEGGQQALFNAIRGGSRGHFRLGAVDYPIDLAIAEPSRDGYKYVVVTARPLKYEEVEQGSESIDHPFTVAVFEVRSFGPGEGQLYTKAALSIDEEGRVRVDQYGGNPGTLRDVKRR